MPKSPLKPKHLHKTLEFPKDFLWGAATSSHQVEGGNTNNDWWLWEELNQPKEKRSGEACDEYNRFEEDFTLAKSLGHNAHRLSIEWSRIEPEEGKFSDEAIEHYKKVLLALKQKGMSVCLTIHHFTNPIWFKDKGGWENLRSPYYFQRFVEKIVPEFKEYVDLWVTINEPGVYVFMGYQGCDIATGGWPPEKNNSFLAAKVLWNLARAHKRAYKVIHKHIPGAKVGIANNVSSFESYHKHSIPEQIGVIFGDYITNHSFYFFTKGFHDFLGVNYYFNRRLNTPHGAHIPQVVDIEDQQRDVSDLGWEIFPEGIFDVLTDLSDGIPIYITECGIASTNDDRRNRFLIHYLQEVYRAIQSGVDIRGFFYWSLIDNFEWHLGFTPRFGLIEIDYSTQKRIPRPSAYVYKEIIEQNGIPHDLLKFLGHTIDAREILRTLHHDERLTMND